MDCLKNIYASILFLGIFTLAFAQDIPDLKPAPGKALVVIIKPQVFLADSTRQNKDYITLNVAPGVLSFVPGIKSSTKTNKTFKAKQIYYLLDPKDAQSQKLLGDFLFKKGDKAGALKAYKTATTLDSAITGLYKNYSVLMAGKGKPDEVLLLLNKVIKSGKADSSTYLAMGNIYLRKKDYQKAASTFEQLLQKNPKNLEALHGLALCKEEQGQLAEATTTLEKIIKENPKSPKVYKSLGRLYEKQNNDEKAMSNYAQYLTSNKTDYSLLSKVGKYYFKKQNFEEAEKYLTKVKGKQSKALNHQLMVANTYFELGKYKKAIGLYKALNARKPKPAMKKDIYKKLAESYVKINNNKNAIIWFDRFSKLTKGKNAEVSYLKAFLKEKINPKQAIQLYKNNIKIFPGDHRNHLQLGLLLTKNKKTLSQGVTHLKKAVTLVDTLPSLWLKIAQAYGKLGKQDDELHAYKQYMKLDPNNFDANIRIGSILLDRKKVSEGIQFLETAYKISPSNEKTVLSLANGYLQSNRAADALTILNKAKETKTESVEIRKLLVDVYVKMGKEQELMTELKALLEKKRENETLLLYAQLLFKSNKLDEANNAIEDIMATDPENIEALMLLGSIYTAKKRYAEAHDVYNEIVIIDNTYAAALYERAEIYLLQSKVLWAEKYFKKTLTTNPKFGLAELGLGKVALLHKKKDAYKSHVEKAYALNPDIPAIKEAYNKLQ